MKSLVNTSLSFDHTAPFPSFIRFWGVFLQNYELLLQLWRYFLFVNDIGFLLSFRSFLSFSNHCFFDLLSDDGFSDKSLEYIPEVKVLEILIWLDSEITDPLANEDSIFFDFIRNAKRESKFVDHFREFSDWNESFAFFVVFRPKISKIFIDLLINLEIGSFVGIAESLENNSNE